MVILEEQQRDIHTVLLFHPPHASSLHLALGMASPPTTLGNGIFRLRILGHVVFVVLLLLLVVVLVFAVVAVFFKLAALVLRGLLRVAVGALRVASVLAKVKGQVRKTSTSSAPYEKGRVSMAAAVISPERTGHQIPGSCGFWISLVGRSQSRSCPSWSCWRGSGAEQQKEKHIIQVNYYVA